MTVRLGVSEDNYEALKIRTMGEGAGLDLIVADVDGIPTVVNVRQILFPNGTVIDQGNGVAEVDFSSILVYDSTFIQYSSTFIPNDIYLWRANGGDVSGYAPTEAGLNGALAAAVSGDTIWLPSIPIALTAGITIPAGVSLIGIDQSAQLNFSGFDGYGVTLSNNSSLMSCSITMVSNGNTAIAVLADGEGMLVLHVNAQASGGAVLNAAIAAGSAGAQTSVIDCHIISASGAGAIGLYVINTLYAANVRPTATTDIYIDTGATLTAHGAMYDTLTNLGTFTPLSSDRAVYDALAYSSIHANDIDYSSIAIHHTLGTGAWQAAPGDHTHAGSGSVVDLIELTNQGADIAETAFPHGGDGGVYRVSWYLMTTVVDGANGVVSVDIAWTDEIDDRALSTYLGYGFLELVSIRLYEISSYNLAAGTIIVRMVADSGGITYLTYHTGDYGGGEYSLTLILEKLS